MENITTVIRALTRGFIDSLKGTVVIFYLDKSINEKARRGSIPQEISKLRRVSEHPAVKQQKPQKRKKVLKRTLQCCGLNGGIFWLSIFLFEGAVLPFLKYIISLLFGKSSFVGNSVWSLTHSMLSLTFSTIWVMPLLLLSKVVNSLWFQDIADSAYRHSRGRPQLLSSFGKLIADTMFSVLIQFLFLIQTLVVSFFPVAPFGYLFSLVHTCMLYSLYSFEYKMYNMGWELHKRLNFIEANWPYFIGFGLPLSFLTSLTTSYIISGCIFSILFPLFIISANEAEPVINSTQTQLQLFSPVIALSNALFHRTMTPLVADKNRIKNS
uniref:Putative etoposide-induced protein 2 n=1 Tax=Rhodnius prolixus TaxID=13249 RepID=R4G8A0_RHOPR